MTGMVLAVSDSDQIILTAGIPKKELTGRHITAEIQENLLARRPYLQADSPLPAAEGTDCKAHCVFPLLIDSDPAGTVMILQTENGTVPGKTEIQMTELTIRLLYSQLT